MPFVARFTLVISARGKRIGRRDHLLRHRGARPGALAGAQSLVLRRSVVLLSRSVFGHGDPGKARPYPGRGDWRVAAQYFFTAGEAVAGWPALIVLAAGTVLALARRVRSGRCSCWRCRRSSMSGRFIRRARRFSSRRCGRTPCTTLAMGWPFCRSLALGAAALSASYSAGSEAAVRPRNRRCRAVAVSDSSRRPHRSHGRNRRSIRACAAQWIAQTAAYLRRPPVQPDLLYRLRRTHSDLPHARRSAARNSHRR